MDFLAGDRWSGSGMSSQGGASRAYTIANFANLMANRRCAPAGSGRTFIPISKPMMGFSEGTMDLRQSIFYGIATEFISAKRLRNFNLARLPCPEKRFAPWS